MKNDEAIHLLKVFLHDPPDKALDIKGHVARAGRYLDAAIRNESVTKGDVVEADKLAAIAERAPPMPDWRGCSVKARADGRFTVFHPVSGSKREIACGLLDEKKIAEAIADIADPLGAEQSLLALWRLLPERLEKTLGPDWQQIPADTRLPDHSIWHHNNIATAWAAATRRGGGAAFLSLSLGPVQGFIAAARSLRDLWTGSVLLSWLTFQAMRPVLEACGPTAFVFPALRGNRLADAWLRQEKAIRGIADPAGEGRRVAGLPNRFLALVPWGTEGSIARTLGADCERAARDAWKELAKSVRDRLDPAFGARCPDWAQRWDEQIDTLPEVSWVAVPERELTKRELTRLGCTSLKDAEPIRALEKIIPAEDRPNYPQDKAGVWSAQVEVVGRIAEAARRVRPVPVLPDRPGATNPAKCTILGSFDQMGPTEFEASAEFWKAAATTSVKSVDGVRIRKGERLCAISLTKRFAIPAGLGAELGVDRDMARFRDTATIAAKDWLVEADIQPEDHSNWSGRWLHPSSEDGEDEESRPDEDLKRRIETARNNLGAPPTYYAILVADGDSMGDWLAGRHADTPKLGAVMHPDLRAYYEGLRDRATVKKALETKRPVGPALHAAISGALNHFAGHLVPKIVAEHRGVLVYAGGDDVLALLPTGQALTAAAAIRNAFSSPETMGEKATLSAGIAIVHHMEDLRQALDSARKAEKLAKGNGRNQLGLAVCRRSGEHAKLSLSWDSVPKLEALRHRFADGMTDRWAYQLRTEAATLDGLPDQAVCYAAVRSELRRLLTRCREGKVEASDIETLTALFEHYSEWCRWEEPAKSFAILGQSASFLARGRDR